jgi:hypothetical protein
VLKPEIFTVRVKTPVLLQTTDKAMVFSRFGKMAYLYEVRNQNGELIDIASLNPRPKN